MESTIKVKTVDYYHRDKNMKVTCGLLPKKLNSNRKYFDDPTLPVPKINLNIDVTDSGAGEKQMESLLEYIRQKGWPNGQKPDFVTNKQLLKCIASGDYNEIRVEAFRVQGVIFLLKASESITQCTNFGKAFEHFLTKKLEDENVDRDGIVDKAVFVATIPKEGGTFNVIYSGEIDAIDDKMQHFELKVTLGGMTDYFWKNQSCSFYWQCVLSNVPTMIVGSRTGNNPIDSNTVPRVSLPAYSLYKVETLDVNAMPQKATSLTPCWTVETSEHRLREFLKFVSGLREKNYYVLSKSKSDSKWSAVKKHWRECSFCHLVINCVAGLQYASTQKNSSQVVNTTLKVDSQAADARKTRPERLAESVLTNVPVKTDVDQSLKYKPSETSRASGSTNSLRPTVTPQAKAAVHRESSAEDTYWSSASRSSVSIRKPSCGPFLPEINPSEIPAPITFSPQKKIVFNAPFDNSLTNRLAIYNVYDTRIAFQITPHDGDISVSPRCGILTPRKMENINITIEEGWFNQDEYYDEDGELEPPVTESKITIKWVNAPTNVGDDEESLNKMFEADGLYRKKTILIEFNE